MKLLVHTLAFFIFFSGPAALIAADYPDLAKHAAEGSPGNSLIENLVSSQPPIMGSNRHAIDGDLETFVRHSSDEITFEIKFTQPVSIRMIRTFSDVLDEIKITLYNGSNKIGEITESEPYKKVELPEKEFYVFRSRGQGLVDRVTIHVDYFSDNNADLHRMYYIDFLVDRVAGGKAGAAIGTDKLIAGSISETLEIATVYGNLKIAGKQIASIIRKPNTFLFKLRDTSEIQGIPVKPRTRVGRQRIAWNQISSYSGETREPSPPGPQLRVMRMQNGDRLVVQLKDIISRAVEAATLKPVRLRGRDIDTLSFSSGALLRAKVKNTGTVILSRDCRLEALFGNETLSLPCSGVRSVDRNFKTDTTPQTLESLHEGD